MSIIPSYQQLDIPYTTTNLLSFPPENLAAENGPFWQNEVLPEHAKRDRKKEWEAANFHYDYCVYTYEPNEAARQYVEVYPNFAQKGFYTSGNKRTTAAEAALEPTGWATRLLAQLGYPDTPVYFYSLHMTHLGLPVDYADPSFLYISLVVEDIKTAIARLIPKPYYWKIEVGENNRAHLHVIGPFAPALSHLIFEGSRVVEPLEPGTELRLLCYLSKPTAPFTAPHFGTYLQAKANRQAEKENGKVYRLSGQLGLKNPRKRKEL